MELKEFITTTLVEIHEGVSEAIQRLASSGQNLGAINPIPFEDGRMTANAINNNKSNVDFDIAVTTTSADSAGANGGIKVMGVNLGGSASTSSSDSAVTRIKFSIPCIPPTTNITPAPATGSGYRRS